MRFTVLAALAACQSMASRPDFRRASSGSAAVRLGDLVLQASKGGDRLGALRKASAQMSSLIAESGAGDISEEDAALFREVIVVVEQNLFGSLDDAHDADVAALDAAVQACSSCNADIARRQTRGGDLYDLQMTAEASQAELDRLQLEVDEATTLNSTTYAKLINLVQLISPPPACPEFPSPRTLSSVDVYFEQSDYVIWYTAQQSAYQQSRAEWEAADAALVAANQAYAVQLAIRDVHYCDFRSELVAACNSFNECYMNAEAHYQQLVPMVVAYQENRIDCYKAGVTIIYQINFLLGEVETQETPAIDTSRYEIDIPKLPEQGLCDLSPLDADEWVPQVSCSPQYCLRISTGNRGANDGTLKVSVSTGPSVLDVASGQHFVRGATVADACYHEPISWVDVQNPTNNAWTGSVLYSTDAESFNAMSCPSCTGHGDTSRIVVDGNSDAGNQASLQCLNMNTCRLFETGPYCLRIITGTGGHNDGTLIVSVSTGPSVLDVASGQHFARGATVTDACYASPIDWVDVSNPTNNAWTGSIFYSTDSVNFNALSCANGCTGQGDTANIAVDGNSDSGGQASLRCFGGSTCRLAES